MNHAENSYKRLFAGLPAVEPSATVIPAVMGRIARARTLRARLHAGLHGGLILGAIAAFVPAVNALTARAARSGFSEYLSLIWSDGGSVFGSWKAFALSIIDSAPILEIGVVIALALVVANSLRRGARFVSAAGHAGIAFS